MVIQGLSGDRQETLLYWSLLVFVIGFYWCPSTREQLSRPHDLIFYLGMLPAFLLLRPSLFWRCPSRSNLIALSTVFISYMGISALWTRGEAETTLAQVGLHTLATATFVIGATHLLSERRWQHLTRFVVAAGAAIAVVSVVAFTWGHQYLDGRLNSAIHFEHPNLFAHYLGFSALLCLLRILNIRKHILLWSVTLLILLTAIVLTESRASLIALIAATAVAVITSRNRQIRAVAGILVVLGLGWGLIGAGDTIQTMISRGDAGRDVIYRTFIERVDDHRWTGLGLRAADNMRFEIGSWEHPKGRKIRHPHSAFVATYYFGGFIGVALLLAVLTTAFFQALFIARKTQDPTGLVLLTFGVVCLLPDGHRLVSNPHLSSWLILWLPIAWIAGRNAADPQSGIPGDSHGVAEPPLDIPPSPIIGRRLFLSLAIVFCALRVLHMGPDIDTPHMWRQCDTAQYIRSFAEEGIDLLHPSVCWLADHKTTILEFPLPEAAAAIGYRVFGAHHTVARAVFLLFFLGSATFLYAFLKELVNTNVTRLTVLIYMVMPLSLFYSRAIHIDFSALFFVYGMAYFFAVGLRVESRAMMCVGALFATVAMVVKAPYVLPMTLPLAVLVARHRRWKFLLSNLMILAFPAVIFCLWEIHVHHVNSQAPDWFFIPHYRKMIQNGPWYFGTLAQRLDLRNWIILAGRFWHEILGTAGLVPAIIGGIVLYRKRSFTILAWLGGSILTLLVFFNLSRHHNYYLIPFLAPLACLIATGIIWLSKKLTRSRPKQALAAFALLLVLAVEHIHYAENNYYNVLGGLIESGEIIGNKTSDSSLVVVSAGNFDCRSPHLLYHAGRYGWSISRRDLKPELIEQFIEIGADTLAIVDSTPPQGDLATWLQSYSSEAVALHSAQATVFIYQLRSPP